MWPLIWGAEAVCILNFNEERVKERLLIHKALSGPQRKSMVAEVEAVHGFKDTDSYLTKAYLVFASSECPPCQQKK